MTPKTLARLLRAADTFTADGNDPAEHLRCVCATSPTRLEATDGHRLIRIDTVEPHGLPMGFYEGARNAKLLDAGAAPVATVLANSWPDFDNILPRELLAGEEATQALCVDPILLSETVTAASKALGAKVFCPGLVLEVRLFGPHEPIRIQGEFDGVSVLALLMSKRR